MATAVELDAGVRAELERRAASLTLPPSRLRPLTGHDVVALPSPRAVEIPSAVVRIPGQAWTYWNKGPGPGEEVYLTTDETEWSNSTGEASAQNLHAVAHALSVNPMSAPPS